jgi:CheY-like chemotaxis protein
VQAIKARPTSARHLTIFIADDDVDAIVTLATILRADGQNVGTCANPLIALEAIRQLKPDVCILDLKMPGKSGYDLAREIRDAQLDPQPLLIAVSGHYLQKTSEHLIARAAGFHHFVRKGSDTAELLEILDGVGGPRPPAAP